MGAIRARRARGFYYRAKRGAWVAYCYANGKQRHIGSFSTEAAAQRARAEAEKRYGFK